MLLKHFCGRDRVEDQDLGIKVTTEKIKTQTNPFSKKITSVTSSGCHNIKKHCEK